MHHRLNPFATDLGPTFVKYLVSADTVVANSTLLAATQHLVKIRASQINGCGFCLDMHTGEGRARRS